MRTIEDVVAKVDTLNDFMLCVEDAMIAAAAAECDAGDGMTPSMKRLHSIIYVLMDELSALAGDLDAASEEIRVSNAILASAHVREMEAELARLRAERE